MNRLLFLLALALCGAGSLRASDYEIKCALYQGDPNGTREAGTLTRVASPTLAIKAGEAGSLLVGGEVKVGDKMLPVGQEVVVTAEDAKGGAARVRVVLKVHKLTGGSNAPQVSTTSEETTATVQPGGSVRVELGKDPKN